MLFLAGQQPLNAKDDYDIYELSLDENLLLPEIKNEKHADKIQEFQYDMAVAFKKSNYDVEIMRDDEVIVITIPASQLFDANDTVLNRVGEERLKPFLRMIKNPGFYKLLLVMHSDNTGSEFYTLNLTRTRTAAWTMLSPMPWVIPTPSWTTILSRTASATAVWRFILSPRRRCCSRPRRAPSTSATSPRINPLG